MTAEIIKDLSLGVLTQFDVKDNQSGEFGVLRKMDAQKIIDRNKSLQNDPSFNNGYTPSRDMQFVASIPPLLYEIWAKEAGIPRKDIFGHKMTEVVRRKLNDPEWKYLRTGQGRI